MGAPEEKFVPGDDCNACEPGLWEDGKTPKFMNVVFRGITKCGEVPYDPPNGRLFKLEQTIADPCEWFLNPWINGEDWMIDVGVKRFCYPDKSLTIISLDVNEPFGGVAFYWCTEETCQLQNGVPIENQLECGGGHTYEGGTATVFWQPDDIPLTLMQTYGFHPITRNLHDRLFLPDNKQCIRIANKFDKTNALFLVDETEF